MKAHLIERTTLSKMGLLDKVKISITSEIDQTHVEANNLKFNIFPESIIEIKRIAQILDAKAPYNTYRFEFINKTMKHVHLMPLKSIENENEVEKILSIKPIFMESSTYLKWIPLI